MSMSWKIHGMVDRANKTSVYVACKIRKMTIILTNEKLLYWPLICFPADTTKSVYFLSFFFYCYLLYVLVVVFACLNLIAIYLPVTSDDVFGSMRNVKFLNRNFYNMCYKFPHVFNRSLSVIFTKKLINLFKCLYI